MPSERVVIGERPLRPARQPGRQPRGRGQSGTAGADSRPVSRPSFSGGTRALVRSAGAALRLNVFGLFAMEIAASHPFDRPDKSLRWQIGIRQGF